MIWDYAIVYGCYTIVFIFTFYCTFVRKLIAYSDTIEDWQVWLYIWPNIKWGLGTLFLFAFFLLFYKVVPTGKVKFKEALPGAVFSALGWQLFSLYLVIMHQMLIIQGYTVNYLVSFFLYYGFILQR